MTSQQIEIEGATRHWKLPVQLDICDCYFLDRFYFASFVIVEFVLCFMRGPVSPFASQHTLTPHTSANTHGKHANKRTHITGVDDDDQLVSCGWPTDAAPMPPMTADERTDEGIVKGNK